MKKSRGVMVAMAVLGLVGAVWAESKFTSEQLKARSYADLGPATIDVSGYPPDMREKYAVFQKTCAQCHTPARAINSKIITRGDWNRYVDRMHMDTKVKEGTKITKAEAVAVVDFLTYDAQARKVRNKAAFNEQTARLKALYKQVQKEQARLQILKQDKEGVQTPAPYVGVKP